MHLKQNVHLLSSPVKERHSGVSPAKGHEDDKGVGGSVIPGEAERAA